MFVAPAQTNKMWLIGVESLGSTVNPGFKKLGFGGFFGV